MASKSRQVVNRLQVEYQGDANDQKLDMEAKLKAWRESKNRTPRKTVTIYPSPLCAKTPSASKAAAAPKRATMSVPNAGNPKPRWVMWRIRAELCGYIATIFTNIFLRSLTIVLIGFRYRVNKVDKARQLQPGNEVHSMWPSPLNFTCDKPEHLRWHRDLLIGRLKFWVFELILETDVYVRPIRNWLSTYCSDILLPCSALLEPPSLNQE